MKHDVVVWRDTLSDGSICLARHAVRRSICYAAIPALRHAHGQGDTEDEALAEIAEALSCFLEREPDRLKTGQAAQDALAALIADLSAEGVHPWVRQVAPARVPATT